MSDEELKPAAEPVVFDKLVDAVPASESPSEMDFADAPADDAADDASDDAMEVNPHAAAAPLPSESQFDAKTLDLLKKLCEHYGVVHHGDVHATAKALGELTGHSQLGAAALIHELADKSGHH